MAFLSVVRQWRRWQYSSFVLFLYSIFRPFSDFFRYNLIYVYFGWCCVFARVMMIWAENDFHVASKAKLAIAKQ